MTESDPTGAVPGLTACALCAGETLGETDPRPGGQLGRLRDIAARGRASLHEVECLDQCNQGDVVVVRPCAAARRRGGRPVWFSGIAGDQQTGLLEEWLRRGGPGYDDVPEPLAGLAIDRASDGVIDDAAHAAVEGASDEAGKRERAEV